MLALDVEFLTGVSVAARYYRRDVAEWPPHPDRLFQALVAAWGRNDPPDPDEREALAWLECQTEPQIYAADVRGRTVVTVYVPPNDAATVGKPGSKPPGTAGMPAAVRVVPELRKNRQARQFPAVIPAVPPGTTTMVRYVWPLAQPSADHRGALGILAREVVYLGHSHTPVRLALLDQNQEPPPDHLKLWNGRVRLPHPGRLADLEAAYEAGRWPRTTKRVSPERQQTKTEAPRARFDADTVTVFADQGGLSPALEVFPLVARRMRDAILSRAAKAGIPIPPLVSGHEPDGTPAIDPHIAIVPLADVGWDYSAGRVMGFGLVWPDRLEPATRRAALRALSTVVEIDNNGEQAVTLRFGSMGTWRLVLKADPDRASLRFSRYAAKAHRWATVLPMVLDRHPKDKDGQDAAALVGQACLNIGLPPAAVEGLDIAFHKHSAGRGAPSVAKVRAALAADSPYRNRPMHHLVLTFKEAIRGPLLLGAGRFRGLGLCLPLPDDERTPEHGPNDGQEAAA